MRWLKDKLMHKFGYAFFGIIHGIRHDSSIALQCILGCVTIFVCLFLHLTVIEWCIILIMIFLVISFEFINSAIESTVDYISLQQHPMAKKIKDLAAGAVLLISICALCVAVLIIGGKIFW
ncbi:diacylglycerol kinase family protein [Merdibacter massiliensis]|uniref:diacylglycerol kinase family protein n=1 Tax=Merdibacter massiliensis TaxID=1871030 RepID=UPI00096AC5D4|nr:diacylglycerol kinase family protein [Merdibacter massiliensis]